MSSTEAELIALTDFALQVKWIKHLLIHDLQLPFKTTQLICDNKSTVTLAKDPISSDRTKHIEVRHRKVQELVESKEIKVTWVSTDEQRTDISTKPLPKPAFTKFKTHLQVQGEDEVEKKKD
jgi:hypothetical protein